MRFLIVGAAGHGQEVAWSLREQEAHRGRPCKMLFFDDAVPKGPLASGLGGVVGTLGDLHAYVHRDDTALVLGMGLPALKTAITERLAPLRLPWATVVHPAATVGPNCRIGEGSYVAAGAIVTVNATVGRFVTVNMHCQVAHDDVLEDLVTLHPDTHLGGNVRVEEGAELGTGSIVTPGLTVGARAVLGAGCTVVRSLPGDATYVGVPAAPMLRRRRATGGSSAR
jgi:sugar O-acyltransferase (sialic acid O-acetyltransferase NeuD family)